MKPLATGRTTTRRGALGGMGALLAAGAWPGARAAEVAGPKPGIQPLRFVAANDFHHENEACDPWMEKLFRQIATTENAAFCLGLGDLANSGKRTSLEAILRHSAQAGMPFFPTPGNHDLDQSPADGFYEQVFPGRRNYRIQKSGWEFLIIDTTEGNKYRDTTIARATLDWLDDTLPKIDPLAPLILATHFPLATEASYCPHNADAVLARFIGHNLRGVFGGHYHARTTSIRGAIALRTNACVARIRGNHDKSKEKGYLVVDGGADGTITTTFVEFKGA